MQKTISITVYGKVQGVFFRQSTRETAQQLGITGSVRNDADGTVRIIATGFEETLGQFTEWCKKGPSKARVERIDVKEIPLEIFRTFMVERP